jgi:hypothetical protein
MSASDDAVVWQLPGVEKLEPADTYEALKTVVFSRVSEDKFVQGELVTVLVGQIDHPLWARGLKLPTRLKTDWEMFNMMTGRPIIAEAFKLFIIHKELWTDQAVTWSIRKSVSLWYFQAELIITKQIYIIRKTVPQKIYKWGELFAYLA